MEALEAIEILAARARQEAGPNIDLPLRRIFTGTRRDVSVVSLLAWPAIISAVAACILLSLALRTSQPRTDAVTSLFAPLKVEMP